MNKQSLLDYASQLTEGMGANPFGRFQITITLTDPQSGERLGNETRIVAGTEYSHSLFTDLVGVMQGEKEIAG